MFSSPTVLYVEDEPSDVLFMQMAFEKVGLQKALRLVEDGRPAIDYLSGRDLYGNRAHYPVPAVVLLDLNLPTVPGFEVLKWMRAHPEYSKTPVVIFSSSTKDEDKARARELGANEFVEKPRSGLKFRDVVEKLKQKWLPAGDGDA